MAGTPSGPTSPERLLTGRERRAPNSIHGTSLLLLAPARAGLWLCGTGDPHQLPAAAARFAAQHETPVIQGADLVIAVTRIAPAIKNLDHWEAACANLESPRLFAAYPRLAVNADSHPVCRPFLLASKIPARVLVAAHRARASGRIPEGGGA